MWSKDKNSSLIRVVAVSILCLTLHQYVTTKNMVKYTVWAIPGQTLDGVDEVETSLCN